MFDNGIVGHSFMIYIAALEPLKLYGEGTYTISTVKDIKVTDSFSGLNDDERKCQYRESFESCTTREFRTMVDKQCGCIPYALWNSSNPNQVKIIEHRKPLKYLHTFLDNLPGPRNSMCEISKDR